MQRECIGILGYSRQRVGKQQGMRMIQHSIRIEKMHPIVLDIYLHHIEILVKILESMNKIN